MGMMPKELIDMDPEVDSATSDIADSCFVLLDALATHETARTAHDVCHWMTSFLIDEDGNGIYFKETRDPCEVVEPHLHHLYETASHPFGWPMTPEGEFFDRDQFGHPPGVVPAEYRVYETDLKREVLWRGLIPSVAGPDRINEFIEINEVGECIYGPQETF